MVFIFGSRLYGKVDQVPGRFFVATKFGHFDYLPLVPMETWLVTSQTGTGSRGVRIPMSAKSVFMGWGRALAIIVGVVAAIITIIAGMESKTNDVRTPAIVAVAAFGFLIFSKTFKGVTHASMNRAFELAALAGVDHEGLAAISRMYGQARPGQGFDPVTPSARSATPRPAARGQSSPTDVAGFGEPPGRPLAVFSVTGLDAAGQDVSVTVHASDAAQATDLAQRSGLTVNRVMMAQLRAPLPSE